jgi:hypothetical protein
VKAQFIFDSLSWIGTQVGTGERKRGGSENDQIH